MAIHCYEISHVATLLAPRPPSLAEDEMRRKWCRFLLLPFFPPPPTPPKKKEDFCVKLEFEVLLGSHHYRMYHKKTPVFFLLTKLYFELFV